MSSSVKDIYLPGRLPRTMLSITSLRVLNLDLEIKDR